MAAYKITVFQKNRSSKSKKLADLKLYLIQSTNILNDFRCETKVEATLTNSGDTDIVDFGQMDVFADYTEKFDNQVS